MTASPVAVTCLLAVRRLARRGVTGVLGAVPVLAGVLTVMTYRRAGPVTSAPAC